MPYSPADYHSITLAAYEAMSPADRIAFDRDWFRRCSNSSRDPLSDEYLTAEEQHILDQEEWSRP